MTGTVVAVRPLARESVWRTLSVSIDAGWAMAAGGLSFIYLYYHVELFSTRPAMVSWVLRSFLFFFWGWGKEVLWGLLLLVKGGEEYGLLAGLLVC